MASACVNKIGMASENFLDCSPIVFPSYAWPSPRISFDREESNAFEVIGGQLKSGEALAGGAGALVSSDPDLEASPDDFEFRLDDSVRMLPADELFYDGKLVPLHLTSVRPAVGELQSAVRGLPEMEKSGRRTDISAMHPYLFSSKAPRCSSRWKGLLGLKKLYLNANSNNDNRKSTASSSTSLRCLLHRSSKSLASSSNEALSLPLLKDLDCESISVSSSRVSPSSSSSGHEHEDLPRLSLDSDKPCSNQNSKAVNHPRHLNPKGRNAPRMRMIRPTAVPAETTPRPMANQPKRTSRAGRCPADSSSLESRGVSVDSPRMNASGQIVFQSLERSSSGPSTCNGGPRFKHRGMERSYSANIRVTPVLNVPVCSLRGSSKSSSFSVFGLAQLFTSLQKKEVNGNGGNVKAQHSRNRIVGEIH